MRDSEGKSKKFGFVSYKDHKSATKAIEALSTEGGLFVGEAKDKERRAEEKRINLLNF